MHCAIQSPQLWSMRSSPFLTWASGRPLIVVQAKTWQNLLCCFHRSYSVTRLQVAWKNVTGWKKDQGYLWNASLPRHSHLSTINLYTTMLFRGVCRFQLVAKLHLLVMLNAQPLSSVHAERPSALAVAVAFWPILLSITRLAENLFFMDGYRCAV